MLTVLFGWSSSPVIANVRVEKADRHALHITNNYV